MLTTAANELTREPEEVWMNPKLNPNEIKSMLKTFLATHMKTYPIRKDFS